LLSQLKDMPYDGVTSLAIMSGNAP